MCLSSAWSRSQQCRNIHSLANSCFLYRTGSICPHATSILLDKGCICFLHFCYRVHDTVFQPHAAGFLQASCSWFGGIAAVGRDSPIFLPCEKCCLAEYWKAGRSEKTQAPGLTGQSAAPNTKTARSGPLDATLKRETGALQGTKETARFHFFSFSWIYATSKPEDLVLGKNNSNQGLDNTPSGLRSTIKRSNGHPHFHSRIPSQALPIAGAPQASVLLHMESSYALRLSL